MSEERHEELRKKYLVPGAEALPATRYHVLGTRYYFKSIIVRVWEKAPAVSR